MHGITMAMFVLGGAMIGWAAWSAFMFEFEYWGEKHDDGTLVGAGFILLSVALAIVGITGIVGAVEHTQCHDIPEKYAEIRAVHFDLSDGCQVLPEADWDGWNDSDPRFLDESEWEEIKEVQGV